MKRLYRRWVCGFAAVTACLLLLCAAVVYLVDPCLYYRIPDKWQPVFFSERYQAAGLAKNVPADTILVGTSMAANYHASQIGETFGTTAVRITIPDGYLSEFDRVMNVAFRSQPRQRVLFGLDVNILIRDESGVTSSMPDYLYDRSRLNDVQYLLNKDTLYYSGYILKANTWHGGETLDEGFTWDKKGIWWNHMTALDNYDRPEVQPQQPADAFLDNAAANLKVVTGWIEAHPDTEFDIFFPPYSILFWDKTARLGETDAVFSAMSLACRTLTAYDNVRLYAPLLDGDIVLDLDNYCDYVHHSGEVCTRVLDTIAQDRDRLTGENWRQTLASWQEFVVNYDYEKYWDTSFWYQWNAQHSS